MYNYDVYIYIYIYITSGDDPWGHLECAARRLTAGWLRTNGVSTSGAAAKVTSFDRSGKMVRPGTLGTVKVGQHEAAHEIRSDPISADPSSPFPKHANNTNNHSNTTTTTTTTTTKITNNNDNNNADNNNSNTYNNNTSKNNAIANNHALSEPRCWRWTTKWAGAGRPFGQPRPHGRPDGFPLSPWRLALSLSLSLSPYIYIYICSVIYTYYMYIHMYIYIYVEREIYSYM